MSALAGVDRLAVPRRRLLLASAAPFAALLYPWTLTAFHEGVTAFEAGRHPAAALALAGLSISLAFLAPILALVMAMRYAATQDGSAVQGRAQQAALLAVAAPPLF